MERMEKKIAFYHEYFPWGGAERITMDIAAYIAPHGYEVLIFTRGFHPERTDGAHSNIRVIALPDGDNPHSVENADCLIGHIRREGIGLFVLPVYNLQTIGYIKSSLPGLKFVFAQHGVPFWEVQNKEGLVRARARRSLGGRLKWIFIDYLKYVVLRSHETRFLKFYQENYRLADAYTVLCEGYKRELAGMLKLDPGQNKIVVIPNSERPVAHPNLDKKRQLLYVGRMTYSDKRVDRLLDIWGKVCGQAPGWELVIVGDGGEYENLERKAASMGLERLRFEGYQTDVERYYRDAAILCLTSTFEAWGLCLTEAQANGVVPIAFGCSDGVKYILSPDGVNGVVVPPFDMEKYAASLLELMRDDERRARMQRNVLLKVADYSPERVGRMWLDLFESLLIGD